MKIARDQVLARPRLAQQQDGARVMGGGGGQVGLVKLLAQARHLLAVPDQLRRAVRTVALQPLPLLLQLAVALLAGEEQPEGVAQGGRVALQEGKVVGRVAQRARPRLEIEDGQGRLRPGIGDRRAEHGVGPSLQGARLARALPLELRVLDELRLAGLHRLANARGADALHLLPAEAGLHLLELEPAGADALQLQRIGRADAQQQRLLRPERARDVLERLRERGRGIASRAQDLEGARESLQEVVTARGRRRARLGRSDVGHAGQSRPRFADFQ